MAGTTIEAVAVHEAGGAVSDDIRAVRVVWRRELLRFARDRLRMVTSLMQPILFLFILGTGLSGLLPSGGHIDFRTFMFPGVISMTVLFTALFSAISVVWDREFGFLREMLVAPVRRGAIVVGKCAGGATVATFQGTLILALAGLVHVPYSPVLVLTLLGEIALAAFTLTAVGMMLASRMSQIQSFQAVMQFVVLPMFFLSGAVFPAAGLPGWLSVMTRVDPLTYAVDPMRQAVFAHVSTPAGVQHTLNPGVTWGAWRVPIYIELAIVAAVGLAALGLAIWQFTRAE